MARRKELEKQGTTSRRGPQVDEPTAYHSEGVLFLGPKARFDHLLKLPEGAAIGQAINDAMRGIEKDNPQLSGILPKSYDIFDFRTLVEILEPFHGRILDPACGSGGMFVQSARFVARHRKNPTSEIRQAIS